MTDPKIINFWNNSQKDIPLDKDHSKYAESLERDFPRGSVVCDLGGGVGADTLFFLSKGHTVYLYDISETSIERAARLAEERKLKGLKTQQADFGDESFSLPESTFDILYSRLALHYFDPKTTSNILNKIYNSLRKGGIAKITLKSPTDIKEMEFLKSSAKEIAEGLFEDEGMLKSRYTLSQLEDILISAGIPRDKFEVKNIAEDLGGRKDRIKSGNTTMTLSEITINR